MEKFEFVKCTILWKFNGKWCTLDIQMVRIRWKFVYNRCTKSQNSGKKIEFVENMKLLKFNRKPSMLHVGYHKNSIEN